MMISTYVILAIALLGAATTEDTAEYKSCSVNLPHYVAMICAGHTPAGIGEAIPGSGIKPTDKTIGAARELRRTALVENCCKRACSMAELTTYC